MIDPTRQVIVPGSESVFYAEYVCPMCSEIFLRRRRRDTRLGAAYCKGCRSIYWRKFKYGLTGAQVIEMMESQRRRCAICDAPLDVHRFHVDHDHTSGKVRGLLCRFCNNGLGMFRDNIPALERAASYLRKHGNNT